jgi:hypothetical protein
MPIKHVWAWPTTLKEAKPKAGTVVRFVDVDLIDAARRGPTAGAKPRSRIESTSGSAAFQICSSFPQAARSPRRKLIGARTRSVNRQVGPDEQKCSRECDDVERVKACRMSSHLAVGLAPRVHPHREQTCEGHNPRSAAGRQEGRT